MNMKLKFVKYQGAGNDFVLLDERQGLPLSLTQQQVAGLCDRRFGIGADGLMTLGRGENGLDFSMRYFNCDGLESTMCGNGGRAITRYADDLGIGGVSKTFSAVDGIHRSTINQDDTISLQMIDIDKVECRGDDFFVQSGSPHYIIFDQAYDQTRARQLREQWNANVNFVQDLGLGRLAIRTFERGVEAETWACGTGATAAAVAMAYRSASNRSEYILKALGGVLRVAWSMDNGIYRHVILTGPAERVFEGEIEI